MSVCVSACVASVHVKFLHILPPTPLDVARNNFCCFKQESQGICGVDRTNLTLFTGNAAAFS